MTDAPSGRCDTQMVSPPDDIDAFAAKAIEEFAEGAHIERRTA